MDKLGAAVITNSVLMMGDKNLLPHEVLAELPESMAMQRALYFRRYVWSETGKRIANSRFEFFNRYLEQLSEEVGSEDAIKGSS